MPLRMLQYTGQLFEKYIKLNHLDKYSPRLLSLPGPKLVVFYNGIKPMPDETILSLQDSFTNDSDPDISVKVRLININPGQNSTLLKACRPLQEYSWLIGRIRENRSSMSLKEAIDKALDEIRLANTLNPQPTYRQMEANILFGQKKYSEAYDIYSQLSNTNLKGAEVYFSAARCKEMLKDSTAMLALLDSAMNCFTKPYLKEAAPYLWARAQARLQAKKYRDAISDMNDYEELMVANINDNFYYLRHQAEVDGRLYQQALNDITRAIVMNPKETFYYAEKASLEIRVGLYDNAIATAKESITIDANDSDGYLFLGVAQCLKGNKKEGIPNLQKAKDMGNLQAETLIEKYK